MYRCQAGTRSTLCAPELPRYRRDQLGLDAVGDGDGGRGDLQEQERHRVGGVVARLVQQRLLRARMEGVVRAGERLRARLQRGERPWRRTVTELRP